jgi:hypothetical protein
MRLDDSIRTWPEIRPLASWKALLLGNGASCAIWPGFAYKSLYKHASTRIAQPLTTADREVFAALGTQNFEEVLRGLAMSSKVVGALGYDVRAIDDRYASIRARLIEAVHSIHLRWTPGVRDSALLPLHRYLTTIRSVFSTNYDLLVYWAMGAQGRIGLRRFVDFMWSGRPPSFDRFDLAVHPGRAACTRIYFLHGGLHLYRTPDGRTAKLVADNETLLSQFGSVVIPEYVAEGTWRQKISTISRSDYLSFTYATWRAHRGPTVVFGSALDEDTDGHILEAMQRWPKTTIAVSIKPGEPGSVHDAKLRLLRQLKMHELECFDSRSHPLGLPELTQGPAG